MMKTTLLCVAASICLGQTTAEAKPCNGTTMPDIVGSLDFRWNKTSGFSWGISDLFTASASNTGCLSCHGPNGTAVEIFNHCANCHGSTASATQMQPPDWLKFDTKLKLVRNSYYRPGESKAQASLLRARDGSMPPGSAHQNDQLAGSADHPRGWCDEIANRVQDWIDAGYP